jgi:Icc-related predicted phosphoesterase
LEKLQRYLNKNAFDKVIMCGDLLSAPETRTFDDYIQKQAEEYIVFQEYIKTLDGEVLYILGNNDWVEGDVADHQYLSNQRGVFIPFEYVRVTPAHSNREANENKIHYELNKLKVGLSTIVVAHDVPYGCLDRTNFGKMVGSESIRGFIEEKRPFIWLGGHIHEGFGGKRLKNTLVYNCSCDPQKSLLRGWLIEVIDFDYCVAERVEI